MCKVTLERWQLRHSLDQESASAAMEGHKNRRDNKALVVRPLG